jgi:hypothetical protein
MEGVDMMMFWPTGKCEKESEKGTFQSLNILLALKSSNLFW